LSLFSKLCIPRSQSWLFWFNGRAIFVDAGFHENGNEGDEVSGRILDLNRYIPALLTFVSNKLSHGAGAKYRRLFGVGMAEWRVLSMLAAEPNIPATRICQVIGLDKALVSRVVGTLRARALVSVRTDSKNGTRTIIRLTAEGERLHDRILSVVREREKILLSAFSEPEIETLINLLRRMHKQADLVNAYEPDAKAKANRRPAKSGRSRPQPVERAIG